MTFETNVHPINGQVATLTQPPERPTTEAGTTEPTKPVTIEVKATVVDAAGTDNPPDTVCPALVKILSTKRRHMTPSEQDFVDNWLEPRLVRTGYKVMRRSNNLVVTVPIELDDGATTESKTLFSCHVDTVHRDAGSQTILYDESFGHIFLDKKTGSCLGADDGAGVWIMLEMILSGVPGTYIFHRGEECGCVGSRQLATEHGSWLKTFDRAIAFDRPNNDEVITHQLGRTRCASDAFGVALADALNKAMPDAKLEYKISDRGVVTDTAHYRHLIPECVNLGVGYAHQHGPDEYLDYAHLIKLRNAACAIDWEALPTKRDPVASERSSWTYEAPRRNTAWNNLKGWDATKPAQQPKKPTKQQKKKQAQQELDFPMTPELDPVAEVENMTINELETFAMEYPEEVATLLIELATDLVVERARTKTLRARLREAVCNTPDA